MKGKENTEPQFWIGEEAIRKCHVESWTRSSTGKDTGRETKENQRSLHLNSLICTKAKCLVLMARPITGNQQT